MIFHKKIQLTQVFHFVFCTRLIFLCFFVSSPKIVFAKHSQEKFLLRLNCVTFFNLIVFHARERNWHVTELLHTIVWNSCTQLNILIKVKYYCKFLDRESKHAQKRLCDIKFMRWSRSSGAPCDIILFTARHLWNLINVRSYSTLTKDFNDNDSKYLI